MRIDFEDKSYISVEYFKGKVRISVGAHSTENPLSLLVNAVELSEDEFSKLISKS